MADVFLSYASSDRDSPIALERALTHAGLTVWWDRELLPGRAYQEDIVAELNRAAAVVVVWSSGSVHSDWVYSEARRASDQDKLVQVRTEGVVIDDLPAPFDAFHCPLVADSGAVLRAVRALLAPDTDTPPDPRRHRAPARAGTLPRGTVTLLRADIANSAQLVHDLGDSWLAAVTRQRVISDAVWDAWHGQSLPADHDAALVAFARASDAVGAAAALQRGILEADWPDGASVGVRVGVHTGSPQLHADGYAGLDVERVVRVAAAAHPGQVLLTEATAHLVEMDLPAGHHTLPLGEHQLHDIPGRLGLLQLVVEGLPREFPAIRTVGAAGSLPTNLTPIVGRTEEITELSAWVSDGERLVTLVGPGGSGKTRLAVALAGDVAPSFADGVFFVPLAATTTRADVWSGISRVLELPPDGQLPPGFFDYVADQRLLLVLDNLEQVADADAVVRELLESAPRVCAVATSRRPLHVAGEREYAVAPLSLAADGSLAAARSSAAVRLFVETAARLRRDFALTEANAADIAALCAAVDGLPLALELMAARIKVLSPAAMLTRIEQSLDLASTDRSRDARQVTLRAAIGWSVDLLTDDQRAVLDHVAIFEGSAPFTAIEAVLPAEITRRADVVDLLFELVDASLVRAIDGGDGEPRVGLLETVRRFGRERLAAAGRLADAQRGQAQFFYDLAARHWDDREEASYVAVRASFLSDLDDLRAVAERADPGVADSSHYADGPVPRLHVVALLAGHAFALRRYPEAKGWSEAALAACPQDVDHAGRAAALRVLAQARLMTGDLEGTVAAAREALDAIGLAPGAVDEVKLPAWVDPAASRLVALYHLGSASFVLGRVDDALATLEPMRALSREPGDDAHRAALEAAYLIALHTGDLAEARRQLEGLLAVVDRAGAVQRDTVANAIADLDARAGYLGRAQQRLAAEAETTIALGDPEHLIIQTETMAEAVGHEHPLLYARVLGCADATRAVEGLSPHGSAGLGPPAHLRAIRDLVADSLWEEATAQGRSENIADLFREMARLPLVADVAPVVAPAGVEVADAVVT
jgi:predicted ATPase/class 3 adenylate cyclase